MNYSNYIVVTPNAEWIPEYPLLGEYGIVKHDDGFWGGHEYTLWPQFYCQNFSHHACIPSIRDNHTGRSVERNSTKHWQIHFYDPVQGKDFVTCPDDYDRNNGISFGSFTETVMAELDKAFWIVAGMTEKVGRERGKEQTDGDSKKVYQRCIRTYKLSLQRMESLRMSWREALSAWRDAQRALLELHGLHTFLKEVVPRIDSDIDFSSKILNVRGAFTTQSDTAYHLYRIGIPVWFICGNRQFKGKVYEIQKPIPWMRFLSPEVMKFKGRPILDGLAFRLDAHMREESVNHFMGENHIRGLLDEIYEFQKGDLSVTRNLKRRRSQSPPPSLVMAPVRSPKTGNSGNASGSNCSAKDNSGNKQSQGAGAKSPKQSRVAKLKSEPNVNHARVLYIPDSIGGQPDLPAYHPVVRQCLESIAPIPDDRSHPALYPLPPPFLLIHQDEDKTAELYLNYIRIKPALIDMILESGYFDRCVWRKMRDWRVILHGDYAKSTPLAPNTTCPFVKKIYDRMPETSSSRLRDHKHEPQDTPLAKRQRVAV
ncbi:hypothetical protein ACEPAF_4640 [Sanghuangporus sanghuang]